MKMLHIVSATIPWMLKLWFIEQPLSFEQRLYVIKLKGTGALQALPVKLNMVVIFDSYHGNVSMTRLCCVHVSWRKITHHFLDCPVLYSSIMKSQTATTTTLRPGHILEPVNFNMKHREATCSWVKQKQYFHRGYSDELWTFGDWVQCLKWWQIKMENWYCIILRSCTIMCACWVPMIYLFYLVFFI